MFTGSTRVSVSARLVGCLLACLAVRRAVFLLIDSLKFLATAAAAGAAAVVIFFDDAPAVVCVDFDACKPPLVASAPQRILHWPGGYKVG